MSRVLILLAHRALSEWEGIVFIGESMTVTQGRVRILLGPSPCNLLNAVT
jgi:hypothetical protein